MNTKVSCLRTQVSDLLTKLFTCFRGYILLVCMEGLRRSKACLLNCELEGIYFTVLRGRFNDDNFS